MFLQSTGRGASWSAPIPQRWRSAADCTCLRDRWVLHRGSDSGLRCDIVASPGWACRRLGTPPVGLAACAWPPRRVPRTSVGLDGCPTRGAKPVFTSCRIVFLSSCLVGLSSCRLNVLSCLVVLKSCHLGVLTSSYRHVLASGAKKLLFFC